MKKITHIFAVALAVASAFVVSPAGQALVHQYPILSGAVMAIGAAGAVYHSPKAGS